MTKLRTAVDPVRWAIPVNATRTLAPWDNWPRVSRISSEIAPVKWSVTRPSAPRKDIPALTVTARMSRKSGRSRSIDSRRRRARAATGISGSSTATNGSNSSPIS